MRQTWANAVVTVLREDGALPLKHLENRVWFRYFRSTSAKSVLASFRGAIRALLATGRIKKGPPQEGEVCSLVDKNAEDAYRTTAQ
jgi:hypothetical protein